MVDTSTNSWKLLYESGRQALQDRKLQEAEQSFSAALQLAEDFAAGDPRLAATLNALARIYSLQRRYLAAAALLNRLLEVTERTLGPTHVQVAGVLTNLAEMYTHLGAAREELELRERVLGIRGDDPNADANTLQRLRDRVSELRAMLAAQEPPADPDDAIDQEPLPIVRTDEYSAAIPMTREPAIQVEPIAKPSTALSVSTSSHDDAYRMSPATAQLSIAPWPGAAATGNTPTGARTVDTYEASSYTQARPAIIESPVEMISGPQQSPIPFGGGMDHGFSDMGRDELPMSVARRIKSRSSLFSIAAGVVLIAGLLAARDYMKSPDDERVSAGSVSLATAAPSRAVVTPTPQAAAPAPVLAQDAKTVERLLADRRAERETRKANEERESSPARLPEATKVEPVADRPPRAPSSADIEKTLRSVDVAVKSIDQRTKAAADSATAIRLQAPTFKKVKIAEP
jgi:tetratricopeptide (TPR) repeat protein